ncbi:hypothetical protein Acr_18g0001770 [Actinidia rufa]|uniref:Uncharacterized protein n=1 Tax=Actinidia rufa TaxID=165716 RepID=A0A7J0G5G1_9ERIC|nr:hypothetical protein Acr_18g0001770 [Actinidia rufa]
MPPQSHPDPHNPSSPDPQNFPQTEELNSHTPDLPPDSFTVPQEDEIDWLRASDFPIMETSGGASSRRVSSCSGAGLNREANMVRNRVRRGSLAWEGEGRTGSSEVEVKQDRLECGERSESWGGDGVDGQVTVHVVKS